ncbi:hypothetical protein QZH41_002187 [Actinostola sp. cb2023]|nr:hypothetical protein QZH41_002187 [Actinostola sp. cb2023]
MDRKVVPQVLLSIQGMILIPDPCFNEPGYEGIRDTDEGDALSHKYNATIRLATIRHAMVAQIRHPPSEYGNLRFTTKSDLLKCITRGVTQMPIPIEYGTEVLDGAVIVHSMPEEYAVTCFLPHVSHTLSNSSRVDIVWDVYRTKNLKEATREKRGKGVRRKVTGDVKMLRNWQAFLEDARNKKELFSFLTAQVRCAPPMQVLPDPKYFGWQTDNGHHSGPNSQKHPRHVQNF